MQDCSIPIANALDILRSYTKPSSWWYYFMGDLVPFWYHVKRVIVWSRKVSNLQNWVSNALVTLTFDKFQSDRRTLNTDLTPMRLCEIFWQGILCDIHDDVTNENIFRVTGLLCGEFTGHRWIPRTKASHAELWCFLLISAWINGWVNNREAGDLRRHRAHYDGIVMWKALKDTIDITTMQGLRLAMNKLWQNAYCWFPDYPIKENRTRFLPTQWCFRRLNMQINYVSTIHYIGSNFSHL